ncbi:hypothetical protein TNCV_2931331 [Trichonephila clavipes]|nr:hypothetical protein TNCV_2931331 [Trichonephila clavipes]
MHRESLDLQMTVLGKCPSSPEDEKEKRERAGTGKERLYPLHKGNTTQVTTSKARQSHLKGPVDLLIYKC